jgi:hypothetical protein
MTTIYVFGSTSEEHHGKGAAKHARIVYGAISGRAEGRQNDSYAIITKELRRDELAITAEQIRISVIAFLQYAREHPDDTFIVADIGCGLAGFMPIQIAPLFKGYTPNVRLPDAWVPLAV